MRVGELMARVVGGWEGENQLRMMPDDDFASSPSTASVALAAAGNAVTLGYTWADFDGVAQEGLIVLGDGPLPGRTEAVWADSWHQQPEWKAMIGAVSADRVSLSGTYGDPDEPAAWHIALVLEGDGGLTMTMANEMADTGAYEVVRATWRPAEGRAGRRSG